MLKRSRQEHFNENGGRVVTTNGGDDWEATGKEFVSVNPMKRFGKPEEVGYLVAFLLSDQSGFINACVIPIDGGQSYKY